MVVGVAAAFTETWNVQVVNTPQRCRSVAKKEFAMIKTKLETIIHTKIPAIEKTLIDAGAPWMDGQPIK